MPGGHDANRLQAFDTGPQFVFNFGGPGVRVHQFGGGRPRRRPRENEPAAQDNNLFNTLVGLLPIIFLFLFPLLSSIFSGGGSSTPGPPRMVFDNPEDPYTQERETPRLRVKYFVNPFDVKHKTKSQMKGMDNNAEHVLLNHLRAECENEMMHKQRLFDAAQGWFTQDPEKMEVANRYELPSCRRLEKYGVRL